MTTATTTANSLLALVYQAVAWTNVALNATASSLTQIAVSLQTADPGVGGTQSTSEIAYGAYARVNVTRDGTGWTLVSNAISPQAAITFPAGTSGSGTATYFTTGKTGGGATAIFWYGTVTPNITCGTAVTPALTVASAITIT